MSEYEDESNGNEDSQDRSFVGQEIYSSRPKSGYESSDYEEQQQENQASHSDPEYKESASGDDNYEEEEDAEYVGNGGISSQAGPSTTKRYYYAPKVGNQQQQPQAEEEYGEEWVVEEEEEDEDNGGDDPRDADFSQQEEDDDDDYNVSADEPEEDAGGVEAFELSNDSDEGFRTVNPRKRPAIKITQPRVVPTVQKRQKKASKREEFLSDDEDLSSEDDQQKPVPATIKVPRTVVNFASPRLSDFSSRETRTRRSIPRKSYVEEESDDDEDEKAKAKAAAAAEEVVEEEDTDKIEKVLWHQPRGIAQAEILEGRKPEPFVLDTDPHAELNWEEQEFFIKWKGQSYLHCQWQCLSDLQQLSGFKKVVNYMKKIDDDRMKRRNLSGEEAEGHDLSKEMELDLLKQYTQAERVFSDRTADGEDCQEYLVKWKALCYGDSTWEKDVDLAFAQSFVDEYKEREAATAVQGKSVEVQRKKVKSSLRMFEEQPDWLKGGQLRDYQLDGLNFLVNSWRNNTNVILADEMGLGKTVQSLSMLGFLQYTMEIMGPFLVVVPLSTIANWAKELRKWLPSMNAVVYVGNKASREMCQNFEFYNPRTGRVKFNTLITTYEVVMKDAKILSQFKWDYMMVDEAHRLKNSVAQLYMTLMTFNSKNKVLVTGTPLQNSVEELWALLHFLDPIKFRNKDEFVARYKNLTEVVDSGLEKLHADLRPHMLRRVIKDVEKSLPPKIERILRVEMSPLQKQYYKWILERNFQDLNKGVRRNQVSLLNTVVELKKCCNHPFLFESADSGYGAGVTAMNDKNKVQRIVLSSSKLVLLDKLLFRLKETGHRVLIFSQMVKMLDILADYLRLRGFQFQRLDGSTKLLTRQQAMEHFNAPGSEDFCFLLSTRAGGLGINLATADTVIIFDSDWNPQNDLQAMSRAHRIGQRDVVNIYRFVTSRSVEEDILERAKKKMVLDHLVIQKLNAQGRVELKENKKQMFDKNELAAILRFGAEELFKEEKNEVEATSKLENMDIDEILERAENVTTTDCEPEEGKELLGAFKVANFSQGNDDVAFWSRLIPPERAKEHQDLGPRAARKIRTYAEDLPADRYSKRRRGTEEDNTRSKRSTRLSRASEPLPRVDGATAQVCQWQGRSVAKKDASAFVKAVKRFGDKSRISTIAENAGSFVENASSAAQLELLDSLMEGCTEAVDNCDNPKTAVLSFFGHSVKAQELLTRVRELTLLGKRVRRHNDPVAQFRLRSHSKNPSWAKSCGWNQVDDARLLLGVYYHGYGNWELIRTDDQLGLTKKIAPAGVQSTSLPRATHLDARASALLKKEMDLDKGANGKEKARSKRKQADEGPSRLRQANARDRAGPSKPSGTRKSARNINRENAALAAAAKEEAEEEEEDKEEGEISDDGNLQQARKEKVDDKDREQRWHSWCEAALKEERSTLKRLQSLKESKSDLPNDQVVVRVKNYLQKLGQKIDKVLQENKAAKCGPEKMATRLWNYVARFSDLPGCGLSDIYQKLKERQPEANDTTNNGVVCTTSNKTSEPLTYKRRHARGGDGGQTSKRRRKGGADEADAD